MRDFRLPPRYQWALCSSGMLRNNGLQLVTDVRGQARCPVFKSHSLLDEWILIFGCFWRNYTTNTLYSPHISRCVASLVSEALRRNPIWQESWSELHSDSHSSTQTNLLSALLMTTSVAQSNTKHSRRVTCKYDNGFCQALRNHEVVCVYFYILFFNHLPDCHETWYENWEGGATTPAYFVISCNP